jgi:hypothetical protein
MNFKGIAHPKNKKIEWLSNGIINSLALFFVQIPSQIYLLCSPGPMKQFQSLNQHVVLLHNTFQINKICLRRYIFQTGQMFERKTQKKRQTESR